MASFLSPPRQFNPYISQIPVDIYATVGLQRQAAYNAGVQQVNAHLQGIAGIQLVRDTDRNYLQQRLTDITSKVNKVAAADWSSQAMLSQVGNLATLIHNDNNIRQAVASGERYMKDEAAIADAKKNGKWAPENEWILRRQMSAWLNEPSAGAQYNSAGFKPYEDVSAAVIKAWKDAKPDSVLAQRPNGDFYAYEKVAGEVVGKDGKTLIQTEVKELRPDEVAEQINAMLTPSQREQLAISGLYNFRHLQTPAQIGRLVDKHFSESEAYFERLLAEEKRNLTLQAGNAAGIAHINERIRAIEQKRASMIANKSAYKQMAQDNPEALKSSVYYENWLNGTSGMIGFSERSSKIVDNPAYKIQLEELKIWTNLRKALKSASGKSDAGKKEDDDGTAPASGVILPQNEQQRAGVTLNEFRQQLLAVQENRDQIANSLLYRHFGDRYVNHTRKDLNGDGIQEEVMVIKPGMEKEATLMMASWWDSYRKGDPNLDITIQQTLRELDEKKLVSRRLGEVVANVENAVEQQLQSHLGYRDAQMAKEAFSRLPSVRIDGVEISPTDVGKYQELVQQRLLSGGSGGTGIPGPSYMPDLSDQELAGYGLTRAKYETLHRQERSPASVSSQHITQLKKAYGVMATSSADIGKTRKKMTDELVRKYKGIFNEVVITLPSSKPAEYKPIQNLIQTLAANVRETDMGGHTDWSSVRQMIGEEHGAQTAYSYVQDRDGNVRLRISNTDVDKGTPQEIELDAQTAKINKLFTPDYLATTRSLLDLGEGLRTGSTFEESIPTSNAKTGRYAVRHQVERFGDRYKVTLYVTDTKQGQQAPITLPINTTLFADWNSLSNFLQIDLNERFIQSLLTKPGETAPSPGVVPSMLFMNNSLINQAAALGQP